MLIISKKIHKKISLHIKNAGMFDQTLSINCQNQYETCHFLL